jgi:hypothetical protein
MGGEDGDPMGRPREESAHETETQSAVRTLSTDTHKDSEHGHSVRTLSMDSKYGRSVQTLSTDTQYGHREQTPSADTEH